MPCREQVRLSKTHHIHITRGVMASVLPVSFLNKLSHFGAPGDKTFQMSITVNTFLFPCVILNTWCGLNHRLVFYFFFFFLRFSVSLALCLFLSVSDFVSVTVSIYVPISPFLISIEFHLQYNSAAARFSMM